MRFWTGDIVKPTNDFDNILIFIQYISILKHKKKYCIIILIMLINLKMETQIVSYYLRRINL